MKEVEIDMPTKGKHYFFTCKSWLARDRGDGKISRTFTLRDGESSMISYKPSKENLLTDQNLLFQTKKIIVTGNTICILWCQSSTRRAI